VPFLLLALACLVLGLAPAPPAVQIARYPAPYTVRELTLGPDGNIWFIPEAPAAPSLSVLGVASGLVTTYDALTDDELVCEAQHGVHELGIISGPGSDLWVSVACGAALQNGFSGFNLATTNGTVTSDVRERRNAPQIVGFDSGGDGNVWADLQFISPPQSVEGYGSATDSVCRASLPAGAQGAITSGPDFANWLPSNNATSAQLVRVTTTCAVSVVATVEGSSFALNTIVSADGSLWLIDRTRSRIVRFGTAGLETDYALPEPFGGSGYLAAAPSSPYVYFSDTRNGEVGRVDVRTGRVEEYGLEDAGATFAPADMAIDAAGNVWTHSGSTILKITFPNEAARSI